MYKVTVLYPAGEGKTFDMEYYKTKHRDLCFKVFGDLERMEIDQGVDGPYAAMGHLFFTSMEALQKNLGDPRVAEAQQDVPNYTNIEPVIQISAVIS
jgi:uncharacterized protein (TIGR02118 family)